MIWCRNCFPYINPNIYISLTSFASYTMHQVPNFIIMANVTFKFHLHILQQLHRFTFCILGIMLSYWPHIPNSMTIEVSDMMLKSLEICLCYGNSKKKYLWISGHWKSCHSFFHSLDSFYCLHEIYKTLAWALLNLSVFWFQKISHEFEINIMYIIV